MRITILTFGSRGDVQPYLALGLGLQAAGHQVRLAAHAPYEAFVRGYGLDFAPVAGDPAAQHADRVWQTYHTQKDFFSYLYQGTIRFFRPVLPALFADCWQACQGAEAIISTPAAGVAGSAVAEKLGVPFYSVWTNPGVKTRAFPHPYLAPRLGWLQRFLGDRFNAWSYDITMVLFCQPLLQTINQCRQEILQLPPLSAETVERSQPVATLYAYSPAVVPKPADWPENVHVTGYWSLDVPPDWQPNPELVKFIEAGTPPVYIGFGSLVEEDPVAMTKLLVDAVVASGQRAVLDAGWANLGEVELPDSIYRIESADAPHAWLFPKMAAVMHHGGAGTVGAGLKAGKPTAVIYSLVTDYYFWGQQMARLGVGTPPIFRKDLTVARLAKAIQTIATDANLKQRAAQLGEVIRNENGVRSAVDAFHQHLPASMSKLIHPSLIPPIAAHSHSIHTAAHSISHLTSDPVSYQ